MAVSTKVCTKCGIEKPLTEFGKDRSARDGLHQHCLMCKRRARKRWREEHAEEAKEQFRLWSETNYTKHLARNKRWQATNRDKMHASMLMSRYKLTPLEYQRMYDAQRGRCVICGDADKLVVDHKHDDTKKVRALLCTRCNTGLGLFRENVDILLAAIGYLSLDGMYDKTLHRVEVQIVSCSSLTDTLRASS
ncbi:MAG TPA: endonuclease VII domain-containing protein [Ktedonobacterales bacterium]